MKVSLDERALRKHNLSQSQAYYLLSLVYKAKENEVEDLRSRFLISKLESERLGGSPYYITDKGASFINQVLIDSNKDTVMDDKEIDEIAEGIRDLFPKGMKPGTSSYWKGNIPELRNRLITFFKRYGEYSKEEILDATKRYLDNYELNPKFMRIAKFFIWKKDPGDQEIVSDLLTFLENKGQASIELDTGRLI